jgi:C1A family cysteine protease
MPITPTDVAKLQGVLEHQGAAWNAGLTTIAQLPAQDQLLRLGADTTRAMLRQGAAPAAHLAGQQVGYPAAFDWRNVGGNNYVTKVEDQGGCGSCVAFGVVAAIEGTFQVQRGNPNMGEDLSEAQLFYCYGAQNGANCGTGWWPDQAYAAILSGGIVDAACFPYTAGDQGCRLCGDAANRAIHLGGWHNTTDVGQMKAWISSRGPMSTCFTVYDDFFAYTGGVYSHVSGNVAGGHCVCVVGYSDTGGFWICKNSWGTGWGESGFFCIAYGQCGIDAEMWAVDGIVETGWVNGVAIQGLWTINQDLNAWVYVSSLGWRKISPDNTNIVSDMLNQLVAAKAAGRPVNVYQENAVIKQIYVL